MTNSAHFVASYEAADGQIPNLDGLRGLSILVVMLSHLVTSSVPGGLGVYVFFIISGFLITRLILSEYRERGSIDLANFYLRRALRLYPVVLVYTLTVIIIYKIQGDRIDWWQPASAIFYFANYYYSIISIGPHEGELMPFRIFWSLSVEEHFYLFFPLAILYLKGDPSRIVMAMVAVIVCALLLRTLFASANIALLKTDIFYFQTQFRIDSIAFGVALAGLGYLPLGRTLLRRTVGPLQFSLGLGVIVFCLVFRDEFFRETLRYTLIGIGITLMLASVMFSERFYLAQLLLNARPLKYIGRLSYSLYVWHLMAPPISEWAFPEAIGVSAICLNFGGSFVISALSYHLLELPFTSLRQRLRKRVGSLHRGE